MKDKYSLTNNPKHWYERAAEMRALAKMIDGIDPKNIMLRLAEEYDRLGDKAEERLREEDGSKVR